ncbi:MAG: Com family DNA-binding transcriptional regulator [Acinetobacter sp.]|uniref:Com family DNA-binding transcriptional regulator n=1 Tax=Acinetobacter sp. TaxID=472 RepID=UPI00391990EB
MENLKCRCCFKLLAKIGLFNEIEIKCPRCKTINDFQSTLSALPERPERPLNPGKIDEQLFYNTAVQS